MRAFALLVAGACALLTTACAPPAPVGARPALWRVQDADTTIWLLGTVHVLPSNVHWQTPAIKAAIDGADMLVTEIPAQPREQASAIFAAAAKAQGLPPIADRLPASQRGALTAAATRAGVSIDALDGMKSWAAAAALGTGSSREAHATIDHGVEAVLTQRFADNRKPHRALETQAGQLALFDTLPEAAQRVLLTRAIEQPDGYARMLAAWRAGDIARIAASFEPGFRGAPDLERTLVTDRNARWSGWIARRMNMPGKLLVAVGAGHLAGGGSVVAMLRARGLKVDRVR